MTQHANKKPAFERVDFQRLNQALLARAPDLAAQWLPGGKLHNKKEWRCADLGGGNGNSFAVRIASGPKCGLWSDFASGEKGSDLISLYAAINNLTQIEAALELWQQEGFATGPQNAPTQKTPNTRRAQADAGVEAPTEDKRRSDWCAIYPVPAYAPPPPKAHPHRGVPAVRWEYRRDGDLLGYICRFTTSTGGKEVIPLTWCINDHDPLTPGAARWHWKSWESPRPLYLPAGTLRPGTVKVITEGEKCADALHSVLPEFDSLSWPGGGKAVKLADWSWIAGERVILWPDTDSQRRRLTQDEQAAGVDPENVEFLPIDKQPGNVAMTKLADILHQLGCEVQMIPHIGPGTKPDGWDVADAVTGIGVETPWQPDDVRAYIDTAQPWHQETTETEPVATFPTLEPPDFGEPSDTSPTEPPSSQLHNWPHFGKTPKATRENIMHAFRHDPALVGLVGLNEFSLQVHKLKPTPWPSPEGLWREVDDILLGEYLVLRHDWGQSPGMDSIAQALKAISNEYAFHPVRDRLLSTPWDGTPRLDEWLFEALSLSADTMPEHRAQYVAHIGRWFLMGMVGRVLQPGSKFDYMLVLEGPQGLRKSSLGKVLAGKYFSDTHLEMGNKDSYLQLQGRWLHEFSELHAITGKDVTLVKAFISSTTDYLRAPFDRRPSEYPRQCVFYGTSNNAKWARDRTGNRRFWPVEVNSVVKTEWVEANLDQLFAEAVHRVQAGERYYPTQEEEKAWFKPEQSKRVQSSAVEEALMQFLCGDRSSKGLTEVEPPTKVTTLACLEGIGIDVAKSASNRMVQNEVLELLHQWGWEHKRSPRVINGKRPWVHVRPAVWPPKELTAADEQPAQTHTPQAQHHAEDPDVPF